MTNIGKTHECHVNITNTVRIPALEKFFTPFSNMRIFSKKIGSLLWAFAGFLARLCLIAGLILSAMSIAWLIAYAWQMGANAAKEKPRTPIGIRGFRPSLPTWAGASPVAPLPVAVLPVAAHTQLRLSRSCGA